VAQIQLIKRRIRSVGNTKQITKAMELVSASKMRRAQEAALRSRAYTDAGQEVLQRLASLTDATSYPLFAKRTIQNRLMIVMTSDRGLAGAFNSNVLKVFLNHLKLYQSDGVGVKVIAIGSKAAQLVTRLENVDVLGVYTEWPTEPSSTDIRPIAHTAIKLFSASEVDAVEVVYTKFFSMIRQDASRLLVLPAHIDATHHDNELFEQANEDITFEPSPQAVLEAMVPRLIESQLYQANLESIASEHSMRMMAMKNASDNATELIDDLTLAFNSARQAGITQELTEIISGAEAIQ
jgi:F-type H+-transporting ATPase subunit gamma